MDWQTEYRNWKNGWLSTEELLQWLLAWMVIEPEYYQLDCPLGELYKLIENKAK